MINPDTSTSLQHVYTLLPEVVIHLHHQNASLLLRPSNQRSHISKHVPWQCCIPYSSLAQAEGVQSIIIRSLMLNSLVIINGGQVPGRPRLDGAQTYPAPRPVEAGTSCFSAWLAVALNALGCITQAGTWPTPGSFRFKKCFKWSKIACIPPLRMMVWLWSEADTLVMCCFENHDCSCEILRSAPTWINTSTVSTKSTIIK